LYLLSDGIYEAPSSTGELWGRTRLQTALQDHHHVTLEQSVERTITEARQWLGSDVFPDDVALLGLELLEDSHPVKEAL
jgi:sigma-B regulation protein RsbU (phosphoserine phosphatase)